MKTNVFKKAGYFAAAFALAASGSIFVPTVAYAEGVGCVASETDGVATVCDSASLIAAVNGTASEIKLGADVAMSDILTVGEGNSLTIDLNGYTLTEATGSDGTRGVFVNGGTLVVKDSSNGQGVLTNGEGASNALGLLNNVGGMLTIEGGQFIDYGAQNAGGVRNYGGLLNINGGVIHNMISGNSGNYGILNYYGETHLNAGTVISENGSNDGGAYAIIVRGGVMTIGEDATSAVSVFGQKGALALDYGSLTINGGTFTAGSYYGLWITNNGVTEAVINDGTFIGERYGLYAAVDDGRQDVGDADIVINGGDFTGNTKAAAAMSTRNSSRAWGMTVTGGTYNTEISDTYVAEGYAEYIQSDKWVVDQKATASEDPIYVQKGETVNLDVNDAMKAYGGIVATEGVDKVSISDAVVTGVEAGYAEVVAHVDYVGGEDNFLVPVYVYDVEGENDESADEIAIVPDVDELDEADVDAIELATIAEAKKNDTDKIAGYFDIDVLLYRNSQYVTNLTDLGKPIKVKVAVPTDVEELTDGYARTYYMIRIHNGMPTVLDVVDEGNGEVSFYSDAFSTYALAYVDTVVTETETVTSEEVVLASADVTTNPNTLDNGMSYVVLMGIATVTMAGAAIYLTRREA